MGLLKQEKFGDSIKQNTTGPTSLEDALPLIATARTGLSSTESAMMRRLPSTYENKSIRDVIAYIVGSDIKDKEAATAAGLKNELGAAGSVIVINGKNAKLTDLASDYIIQKDKKVGNKNIKYQQLEIEVSAVQQGGYQRR